MKTHQNSLPVFFSAEILAMIKICNTVRSIAELCLDSGQANTFRAHGDQQYNICTQSNIKGKHIETVDSKK